LPLFAIGKRCGNDNRFNIEIDQIDQATIDLTKKSTKKMTDEEKERIILDWDRRGRKPKKLNEICYETGLRGQDVMKIIEQHNEAYHEQQETKRQAKAIPWSRVLHLLQSNPRNLPDKWSWSI
jgi:hypothetical protein